MQPLREHAAFNGGPLVDWLRSVRVALDEHVQHDDCLQRRRHDAPYTGAGGGAFASNSRMATPTASGSHRAPRSMRGPCCQPSATEIMPPSTSNTRPVTPAESALPSHATSGEMLAGSLT